MFANGHQPDEDPGEKPTQQPNKKYEYTSSLFGANEHKVKICTNCGTEFKPIELYNARDSKRELIETYKKQHKDMYGKYPGEMEKELAETITKIDERGEN